MARIQQRLNPQQIKVFKQHGFLVVPNAVPRSEIEVMHALIEKSLHKPTEPFELESSLGYPGSPTNLNSAGKNTIRRLKDAYMRHTQWRNWATNRHLLCHISDLLDTTDIALTRCHHNCLMTKLPRYSSDTGWHQDIRYWSFQRPNLITAWLSITPETPTNGCLQAIPGSHQLKYQTKQFDHERFFRDDLAEHQPLIDQAVPITTQPGDLLLFDARLLHRADRNQTDQAKYAVAFTYKHRTNRAIENTRSALMQDIALQKHIESLNTGSRSMPQHPNNPSSQHTPLTSVFWN